MYVRDKQRQEILHYGAQNANPLYLHNSLNRCTILWALTQKCGLAQVRDSLLPPPPDPLLWKFNSSMCDSGSAVVVHRRRDDKFLMVQEVRSMKSN